jgi:hypothetical protein
MRGLGLGLTMLVLAVVVAAVPASAQSVEILKVKVPFDFSLAGLTKPAGEYTVTTLSGGLVTIGNREHGSVFVQIRATEIPKGEPKDALVFHKINDQYFLAAIWTSRDSNGRELYMSRQEREKLAQGEPAVTTVLMASAR